MLDVWCLADTRCWMSGNLPWPCSFIWTSKDTSGAEVNLRLREGNSLLLRLKTQGHGWALCTEEEPCDIPCIPAHPLRWGQHRTAGRGMLLATVQPHNPILRFLVPHMWHWRAGEKLLGWKHLIYPFCDRKGQMQAWNLGRFIFIGSLYESISIWIEAEEQEGEKTLSTKIIIRTGVLNKWAVSKTRLGIKSMLKLYVFKVKDKIKWFGLPEE